MPMTLYVVIGWSDGGTPDLYFCYEADQLVHAMHMVGMREYKAVFKVESAAMRGASGFEITCVLGDKDVWRP